MEEKQYLVIVNRKYIVPVMATSNYHAEHRILDDVFYGIETALSFDPELNSADYIWAFSTCKVVDFDKFMMKVRNRVADIFERENEMLDDIERCRGELEDAQLHLMAAQANLDEAIEIHEEFVRSAPHDMDLGKGVHSPESIQELRMLPAAQ